MFRFKQLSRTALITAITFILPILINAEAVKGKDNNPSAKIRLRVEITGISGDGLGETIGAYFYLQPDGTFLNARNIASSALTSN